MLKMIWYLVLSICKDREVKVFFFTLPFKHGNVTVKYLSSSSKQKVVLWLFLIRIEFKSYCWDKQLCAYILQENICFWTKYLFKNPHLQSSFLGKYSFVLYLNIVVFIFEILLPSSFCTLIIFSQLLNILKEIYSSRRYSYFVRNIN
jgi:hypothetical protein